MTLFLDVLTDLALEGLRVLSLQPLPPRAIAQSSKKKSVSKGCSVGHMAIPASAAAKAPTSLPPSPTITTRSSCLRISTSFALPGGDIRAKTVAYLAVAQAACPIFSNSSSVAARILPRW
eukprot:CAMPEP_0181537308 /NCGR_PEP_ID=MMETSP1110-20121109/75279_1 /TAXON_ID=174948 /ORGANISM="Symbiodinium sp., Strain CCMP421" /LENGTH=119 /DNA_ID=CAMNT_0023668865 /DNA_START=256 /DNA_END=617 /DNA_ORIENTATION=-